VFSRNQQPLPKQASEGLSFVQKGPGRALQKYGGGETETARPPSRRNPFPGESFFMVPIALYASGLSRWMKPSQFIRYVTLLRVANYRSSTEYSIDLRSLAELDGVSTRAARDAHIKLQEFGLIRIAKTNPFTYTLVSPAFWEQNFGNIKPKFKRDHSLKVRLEWVPG
jgi:hypothetical protein